MAQAEPVVDPAALDRKQVTFADGETGRVYTNPHLEMPVPSVTTIIDEKVDPEKDEALDGWRDHFDGNARYSSPHHADQLAYKGARGTLGHYAILSQLVEIERTDEEDDAEELLKNWGSRRPTIADDDIDCAAPFDDPNCYEGEQAWDRCMRDVSWAIKRFEEVAAEHGITEESVITAEQYILDEQWGYAGQFDLLYEAEDGAVTLADLKLSSGIRKGYLLQLAAYANAVDEQVDRLQVIRLHPDKQDVEVEDDRDWDRTVEGLISEFRGLADICHSRKIRPLDDDELAALLE